MCFCAILCGGADSPDGGDPIPISNGQRLAWTQLADSAEALHAHTYRLYVDGRVAELSDLRCQAIRSPFSYECRGGLPSMTAGRHELALTSVFNGSESSRSEPLVVIVSVSKSFLPVLIELRVEHCQVKVLHPGDEFSA